MSDTSLENRLSAIMQKKADINSKVQVAKALLEKAKGQMDAITQQIQSQFGKTPDELDAYVKEMRPKVEAELTALETALKGL